jgi:hypothetical protein
MTEDSEWTLASDALRRAVANTTDEWEAINKLRSHALDSTIETRGIIKGELVPLASLFWARWRDTHIHEDWENSRFQGYCRLLEHEQQAGRFRELRGASKVEFRTAELKTHFPKSPPPPEDVLDQANSPRRGGRPPKHWWSHFAEELAVTMHTDFHDGSIDGLINKVLSSLEEQGRPVPSRSAIQDVVRAVIARTPVKP